MKKIKKLLRNLCIILLLLVFHFYSSCYYISKDECIKDNMRALYVEGEEILELKNKNHYRTLIYDKENDIFSIIGSQSVGFLYRIDDCSTDIPINKENNLETDWLYNKNMGFVIILYRNNKDINKVTINFDDGEKYTINEWNQDFAGLVVKAKDWKRGYYISYNSNNDIIEEMYK